MLSKKLSSASSEKTVLVGSATRSVNAANVTGSNVQFNNIAVQTGDLIVFVLATRSSTTPTATLTTSGYTSIYSVASNPLRAQAFYKVSNGTETIINFEPGGGAGVDTITAIVAVFRGFQYNSRITQVFSGSGFADPPATSCASKDLIIAVAHTDYAYPTASIPDGYSSVAAVTASYTGETAFTSGTTTQMVYKIAESTSENPDIMYIAFDNTWVAATIRCTPI
jgi:hypothetical protein